MCYKDRFMNKQIEEMVLNMSKKICKDCLHYKMCLEKFRKLKEENEYIGISEDDYFSSANDCDFYIVNAEMKEKAIKEAEAELCDKQVEEMANVTRAWCEIDNSCGSCHWKTCNECLAECLVKAGYRKVSDVAREVIDNTLSKIRTMIREIEKIERNSNCYFSEFNGGSKTALKTVAKDIAELKKKYESEGKRD